MITSSSWQQWIVWILTYAAHSTLLLALAWCVTRRLSRERLRWHERIWKAAILGGLLSTSLQVGFDVSPAAGRLELRAAETAALASTRPDPGPVEVLRSGAGLSDALGALSWEGFLLGLWMLGGLIGLALFLFAWRRVADRLAGRVPLRSGPAHEALVRLAARAGLRRAPRLVESSSLKSPATIGVFLPQICVPRRVHELPPEQQQALVAHELAHILRADPLWFFVIGLIERVFFFQPLHRVARRELEELAEFLSDDWAAQNTGDEVGLARCLTEVATWVLELRPVVAVVPMAASNSRLAARVGRLLDESRRPQDHGASRAHGVLCAAGLTAAVLALPGAGAVAAPGIAAPSPASVASAAAAEGRHGAAPEPGAPKPGAPSPVDSTSVAPAPALDDLLGVLDDEVDLLVREVGALGEEIVTEEAPSPERLHAVRELGRRMNKLRERQERLRELLPDLVVPEGPAFDSPPQPLLEKAR